SPAPGALPGAWLLPSGWVGPGPDTSPPGAGDPQATANSTGSRQAISRMLLRMNDRGARLCAPLLVRCVMVTPPASSLTAACDDFATELLRKCYVAGLSRRSGRVGGVRVWFVQAIVQRQADGHGRAATRRAVDGDFAAMQHHCLVRDRQPEAEAA